MLPDEGKKKSKRDRGDGRIRSPCESSWVLRLSVHNVVAYIKIFILCVLKEIQKKVPPIFFLIFPVFSFMSSPPSTKRVFFPQRAESILLFSS